MSAPMQEHAPVPGPSALDELLRGLAQEGELVDEGAITLDEAGARSKLQEYRLAEPEMWAVTAVRAAGWAGATRVRYRGGNDPEIEIEGVSLEPTELESLSVHALVDVHRFDGGERSRAAMRRTLAIAVMGAMETSATTVVVESHGDELVRLTMSPAGESIETTPLDDPPRVPFVRIVVDRPGLFASRSSRELQLLRTLARYARFEILLGGSAMPRMIEERLPDHPFEGTIRFRADGLEGFCTRDENLLPEHRGQILFVVGGVVLATRPLGDPEHAVVVHGEFRGDLSDSEIREDELFGQAMTAARDSLEVTLAAKVNAFDPGAIEPRTPFQRRLVIGTVMGAAAALMGVFAFLSYRTEVAESNLMDVCRVEAGECLEAGNFHRDCANRHADPCDGIAMQQHRLWSIEAFERACEAGILGACLSLYESRVDWIGGSASADDEAAAIRRQACSLDSASDCLALSRDFAWSCAAKERCVEVVEAAQRHCELDGSTECDTLGDLTRRLEKVRAVTSDATERARLDTAIELATELKGR